MLFIAGGYKDEANLEYGESNREQEEWNQPKEETKRPNIEEEIDPLYDMIRVPKLDQLFINSTFVQQVYFNHFPYFIGYSKDGKYAAFIDYIDTNNVGYRLKIYETPTGINAYSTFIPDVDGIFDTDEFIFAQKALDDGFGINTPPKKISWNDELNYQWNEKNSWVFNLEEESGNLLIRKKNTNLDWSMPALFDKNENGQMIQFFSFPGKPEWVTILPISLSEQLENPMTILNPIFIYLDHLDFRNSVAGKELEADNWLYGNFLFLYDQGIATNNKGFIAASSGNGETTIINSHFNGYVDQWVYLDPSGRMNWYGNNQGIFNREGKPIQELGRSFSYRINIKKSRAEGVLQYFVIDQLDEHSLELIRTIEFKWSSELEEMEPIQKLKPV